MARYPGISPNTRFSPGYYQATRYSFDPVTGRIVEERPGEGRGAPAQAVQRYSGEDIRTSGLGGTAGGTFEEPDGAARVVEGGYDADRGGGYAEEPGAQGEAGQGGSFDIDDFGGYSTFGTLAGMVTGMPGLGIAGGVVDTIRDKIEAEEFDPEYEGSLSKWGSALVSELTGGLLGRGHRDRSIDEYRGRTGTGLNRAALAAAQDAGPGGYSGPKGIAKATGAQQRAAARKTDFETEAQRKNIGSARARAKAKEAAKAPGRGGDKGYRGGDLGGFGDPAAGVSRDLDRGFTSGGYGF